MNVWLLVFFGVFMNRRGEELIPCSLVCSRCLDGNGDVCLSPQHNISHDDDPSAKIPELQAQDIVTISFTGRLASSSARGNNDDHDDAFFHNSIGPIFQHASRWTIVIGDKDVVNAVEMGVRFMTHKTARVYSHAKFALGPGTREPTVGDKDHHRCYLPPHASVFYDIVIDDVLATVDDRALLQVCQTRKIIGNDIFRHEQIQEHEFAKQRAIHQYKKAIALLESLHSKAVSASASNDDKHDNELNLRSKVWQCLLDCRNNIAAVHLSCRDYHAAKLACIETLKLDPSNSTALVRAAKACLYDPSSSFVEASSALRAAQDVLPANDGSLESLRRQLHKLQSMHKEKERLMAAKMARGATTRPSTTSGVSSRSSNNNTTTTTNSSSSPSTASRPLGKTERQGWYTLSSSSSSFWIVVLILGLVLGVLVPLLGARYNNNKSKQ
jgi:hypothetical protein